MLPKHILPHLSPHSAHLYLALLAHRDPHNPDAPITLPLKSLRHLTGQSRCTCLRALASLRTLG